MLVATNSLKKSGSYYNYFVNIPRTYYVFYTSNEPNYLVPLLRGVNDVVTTTDFIHYTAEQQAKTKRQTIAFS